MSYKYPSQLKPIKMPGVGRGNNPISRSNLRVQKVVTKATRKKISEANLKRFEIESNHPRWKGDEVGYRNLHKWVEKWLGKPNECIFCGKKGNGHQIHWANVSKQYKRDLMDWVRLCAKCHKEFDKK